METAFVGRRTQVRVLETFVDGVATGPRSLCLEGAAGIGKTSLWDQGVFLLERAGCVVLTARAAQAEAQLAFSTVGDLFTPVLDATLGSMPTVQRRAIETALLLRVPSGEPPDARVLGLALLSAVRELSRERPAVVAVDDVQWVDETSSAVLAFMMRRLEREHVGFLLTVRGTQARPSSRRRQCAARRARPHGRALPLDDTHRLLQDRLGLHLPRPRLSQLHRVADGNPFLVLELGRALADGGLELTDDPIVLPASINGTRGRPPAAADAPSTLETLVAVAALAAPTLTLLEQLSTTAVDDIDLARGRGLVTFDADRVRFTHPLLASACYAAVPAATAAATPPAPRPP